MSPSEQPVAPGLRVDETGLRFRSREGVVLDVLFDGRRVWSVDVDDHPAGEDGVRTAEWPAPIRKHLDGAARVELCEHVTGENVGFVDARFGSGEGRVRIVDGEGRPVAVTKWGRLNRPFAATDRSVVEDYLDQVEEVLRVLREDCGVPSFLSFGSLLGAVREGALIGHDVDVDLGYLSRHTHPADVMRESFRVERVLRRGGWRTRRTNGGFLALDIPQVDGGTRNVDIFSAFLCEGRLYQVHDVATEADESVVLPLGTVELEGRALPAPARPEVFLEAAYGADWRIPNPAFTFQTPRADRRRIRGWFGGLRERRDYWGRFYSSEGGRVPTEPSSFAVWVAEREEPGELVEVGAGTGRDTRYFLDRGFDVTAFDVVPRVAARNLGPPATDLAGGLAAASTESRVRLCNFDSLRDALAHGADLAHRPGSRVLYGRFWLHALTEPARESFWRFASMALRRGGRCYLEFRTDQDAHLPKEFGEHYRRFLDPDEVETEVARHGGRVVHREAGHGLAPLGREDPHLCRMILEWSR